MKHLFVALNEHSPQLRHLILGDPESKASPALYSLREHAKILRNIAPRLHSIALNCHRPDVESNLRKADCSLATTRILKEAEQLQSLTLVLDERTGDWPTILLTSYWPHLRVLDLGDGALAPCVLRTVVQAHKDTLRELSLHGISLADEYWEDVATEIGRSLHLHFISLSDLENPVGFPTIGISYQVLSGPEDSPSLPTADSLSATSCDEERIIMRSKGLA